MIAIQQMNTMNAPRAALKHYLKLAGDPNREEILEEVDKEDQLRKIGLQVVENMQAQQEEEQKISEQGLPAPEGGQVG